MDIPFTGKQQRRFDMAHAADSHALGRAAGTVAGRVQGQGIFVTPRTKRG